MIHVITINKGVSQRDMKECGCRECQSSCQSACKVSCTVANQKCEKLRVADSCFQKAGF